MCSVSEPYWLEFRGPYEMPVLALTADAMRRLTPDPDQFLGVRLGAEDPDCGLLSSFVGQVAARMSGLSGPMISRVEANILDLLGGVLSARTRPGRPKASQQIGQIKAYIVSRLRDRRLGPGAVADAFGLSTRCLRNLFESEPVTIGRYIRMLRVPRCSGEWCGGRAVTHRSGARLRLLRSVAHDPQLSFRVRPDPFRGARRLSCSAAGIAPVCATTAPLMPRGG